ncbi:MULTISPECIES: Lsr2 family protein [Plantibacter]|uniref:histone-like nucleoid-structuring protein Lsr2 n=1 Tax=Plantibacter TaxID=190323 RepID=UPI00314538D4
MGGGGGSTSTFYRSAGSSSLGPSTALLTTPSSPDVEGSAGRRGSAVGWHDGGMAQRMITTLIDDLDGVELARGSGETVRFGLDGRDYEIDLSDHNAAELREVLAPYVGAGRRNVALRSRRGRR